MSSMRVIAAALLNGWLAGSLSSSRPLLVSLVKK
jgi:hypothetical protein